MARPNLADFHQILRWPDEYSGLLYVDQPSMAWVRDIVAWPRDPNSHAWPNCDSTNGGAPMAFVALEIILPAVFNAKAPYTFWLRIVTTSTRRASADSCQTPAVAPVKGHTACYLTAAAFYGKSGPNAPHHTPTAHSPY